MNFSNISLVSDDESHETSFPTDYRDLPVLPDPRVRQNRRSLDVSLVVVTTGNDVGRRLPSLSLDDQSECESNIRNLLEVAGKIDWNGEGADPVSEEAICIALKIVGHFPGDIGIPEVSADPHGRVDFDWHLDNGAMFTISIGKDGEAAISGLYEGQSRLTGMAWDREEDIPSLVYCGLDWLADMKSR